jgi:hypothetical protein
MTLHSSASFRNPCRDAVPGIPKLTLLSEFYAREREKQWESRLETGDLRLEAGGLRLEAGGWRLET